MFNLTRELKRSAKKRLSLDQLKLIMPKLYAQIMHLFIVEVKIKNRTQNKFYLRYELKSL